MREADEEIGWLVKLVSEVRSVRSEMNVPAGAKIPLVLVGAGKATRARAEHHEETIKRLARLDAISFAKAPPKGSAQIVLGEATAALPLAGVIDMGAERDAPGARDREVRRPRSARSTPSWPTRASSPRRRPRWWRRTASAAPISRRPCAKLQAALKRVEAATDAGPGYLRLAKVRVRGSTVSSGLRSPRPSTRERGEGDAPCTRPCNSRSRMSARRMR